VSAAEGLVGRDAELGLAAAEVHRLSEGLASVRAIEGEAGIGKTRLVQSIVHDAQTRDVTVFFGQAHPFERTCLVPGGSRGAGSEPAVTGPASGCNRRATG
jgi:hypothetical protein